MADKSTYSTGALSFELKDISSSDCVQRLGKLKRKERIPIDTPHYFPISSRGFVPHLSQDIVRDKTSIKGIYLALEDFIEKTVNQESPIYTTFVTYDQSRLRTFIALQKNALLFLGPRRHPPVPARAANTHTSIAIQTAIGFSTLESDDYVEAAQKLRPDIVLGMADYEHLKRPGVKRLEKMGDRTLDWTQTMVAGLKEDHGMSIGTALFAPVLPIDAEQQSTYLGALEEELTSYVSGFVVYDAASVDAIPAKMNHLPRLALTKVCGPHDLLNQIALGIDIFLPHFVGEGTDTGLALTFTFPSPERPSSGQRLVLGVDLWLETHASDVSPLSKDCTCYTCRNHHRAYIRHLLTAKEMLAWVLLQIHNYHIMDNFFAGVRGSMSNGTFEHSRDNFEKSYEWEFPASTGQGPRLRGYQVKSGPAEPRRNPQAFRSLENQAERLADADLPSPSAEVKQLEIQGFAKNLG